MHGSQAVSRPIPLTFAHPSSLPAEQPCLAAFALGLPVISTLRFCTSTSGSHHASLACALHMARSCPIARRPRDGSGATMSRAGGGGLARTASGRLVSPADAVHLAELARTSSENQRLRAQLGLPPALPPGWEVKTTAEVGLTTSTTTHAPPTGIRRQWL